MTLIEEESLYLIELNTKRFIKRILFFIENGNPPAKLQSIRLVIWDKKLRSREHRKKFPREVGNGHVRAKACRSRPFTRSEISWKSNTNDVWIVSHMYDVAKLEFVTRTDCIMGCTGRTLATYRLCRRASWERIKVDSVSGVPAKCVYDWSAVINHKILKTSNKVRAMSACGATGHVHDSVWSSEVEFREYSWSFHDTFNIKGSFISMNTLPPPPPLCQIKHFYP